MNLAKFLIASGASTDTKNPRVGIVDGEMVIPLQMTDQYPTLSAILSSPQPIQTVQSLKKDAAIALSQITFLAPIDHQEVWAAGVTYKRSQTARMEESEAAASCYDLVYKADRPELFFKAVPHRVRGHKQPLRIRSDATWNVPEPELTLVLSSDLRIVGLTIGNDMSSRDIEGENPLYLPQAKCYDQSAGLGPWVTLFERLPPKEQLKIDIKICRGESVLFDQSTSAAQMAREFEDLVGWLGRDMTFPDGAFLMTGTGIVPNNDFTLHPGDVVSINIAGIGTLENTIVQG
jgi:2-dehydro-3-deoxy-D-arabinonate dehydratase